MASSSPQSLRSPSSLAESLSDLAKLHERAERKRSRSSSERNDASLAAYCARCGHLKDPEDDSAVQLPRRGRRSRVWLSDDVLYPLDECSEGSNVRPSDNNRSDRPHERLGHGASSARQPGSPNSSLRHRPVDSQSIRIEDLNSARRHPTRGRRRSRSTGTSSRNRSRESSVIRTPKPSSSPAGHSSAHSDHCSRGSSIPHLDSETIRSRRGRNFLVLRHERGAASAPPAPSMSIGPDARLALGHIPWRRRLHRSLESLASSLSRRSSVNSSYSAHLKLSQPVGLSAPYPTPLASVQSFCAAHEHLPAALPADLHLLEYVIDGDLIRAIPSFTAVYQLSRSLEDSNLELRIRRLTPEESIRIGTCPRDKSHLPNYTRKKALYKLKLDWGPYRVGIEGRKTGTLAGTLGMKRHHRHWVLKQGSKTVLESSSRRSKSKTMEWFTQGGRWSATESCIDRPSGWPLRGAPALRIAPWVREQTTKDLVIATWVARQWYRALPRVVWWSRAPNRRFRILP